MAGVRGAVVGVGREGRGGVVREREREGWGRGMWGGRVAKGRGTGRGLVRAVGVASGLGLNLGEAVGVPVA